MMIRGWRCVLLWTLAILWQASAGQAQQDRGEERIARLVRELGAESYQMRESAHAQLAALGAASRDQLVAAAAASDPEVRLRAEELLRRIRIEQLWQASPVQLHAKNQPLSSLLPLMAAQSDNRVSTGARYEVFHDGPVTVESEGVGYWQLLDELCRQSGNHMRPHYDVREKGVVLSAGPPGKCPIAYSGPLRVELISARRVYDDELTYKNGDLKRLHSFKLVLSVLWEDRFQLTAYRAQPRVMAATTDTGEKLLPTEASYEWNVAGPGVRQLTVELKLQPPALAATSLTSLLLEWSLLAVDDLAELEIESLAIGQSTRGEGLEVLIEACQAKAESLCEVVLVTRHERLLPDPPESVFQENSYELFDSDQKAWPLIDQAHDFRGELVRSRLVFRRESSDAKIAAQSLKMKYPRIRSQRDLQVMFRDISLPPPLR